MIATSRHCGVRIELTLLTQSKWNFIRERSQDEKTEQSGNYFSIRIANKVRKIDGLQSRSSISQSDEKIGGIVGYSKKKIIRIANCNEGYVRRNRKSQWRGRIRRKVEKKS